MVTTLLEAAKAIQESARKGQAAINMPLLLDLEKAIAQEQEIARRCYTCKSFAIRNVDKCRSCNKDYSNWEPKP